MDKDELMKAFSEFLDKRTLLLKAGELKKIEDGRVYLTKSLYDESIKIAEEYGYHPTVTARFLRIVLSGSELNGADCTGIGKSDMDNLFKYSGHDKSNPFKWTKLVDLGIIGVYPANRERGLVNRFYLSGKVFDRFNSIILSERRKHYDDLIWSSKGDHWIAKSRKSRKISEIDSETIVHPSKPEPAEKKDMNNLLDIWNHDSIDDRYLLGPDLSAKLDSWVTTHNKLVVPFLLMRKKDLLSTSYSNNFQQLQMDAVLLSRIFYEHRDELLTYSVRVCKSFLDSISIDSETFTRLSQLSVMGVKLVCIEGFGKINTVTRVKSQYVIDYQNLQLKGDYKDHPDLSALLSIIEVYPRLIKGGKVETKMGWLINNRIIDKSYNRTQHDHRLQKLANDLGLNLDLQLRDINIVTATEVIREQTTDEETQATDKVADEHSKIAREHGWEVYEQLTDRDTQKIAKGEEDDGYYNSMGEHE